MIHIFLFLMFCFCFFYSTSDFRIHIICLKIFTYEQHGVHQGLFNFLKFGPFVSCPWYNLCEHVIIYTIKDALNSQQKFQVCSRYDLTFESVMNRPLGAPKINTIDCIIVFLNISQMVHCWFSGTLHVTVLSLKKT